MADLPLITTPVLVTVGATLFFLHDEWRVRQLRKKPQKFVHPDVALGRGIMKVLVAFLVLGAAAVSWVVWAALLFTGYGK